MFELHKLARSQMLKAGAQQKRKSDLNVKQYQYNVCNHALLNIYKTIKMQRKFSWNWKGPYTFIQKISDHINEIFQGSFRKILSGHTSAGNNLALIYTCTSKNEIMNDYKKYLQFCYNYSVDFFSIYNYLKFIFTDVS